MRGGTRWRLRGQRAVGVLGLGLFELVASSKPVSAQEQEAHPKRRGFHASLTLSGVAQRVANHYELRVNSQNGRFGAAEFSAGRTGFGGALVGVLGYRLVDTLVVGAELQYSGTHAPAGEDYAPAKEIGAPLKPRVDQWSLAAQASYSKPGSGIHVGGSLGYAGLRERFSGSATALILHTYGVRAFVGYSILLADRLQLRLTGHVGVLGLNPLALIPSERPIMRSLSTGFGAGVAFN